jgi:hypothetical protein
MTPRWAKRLAGLLILVAVVSGRPGAGSQDGYMLGGVACEAAPGGGAFYCFGGFGLLPYEGAVTSAANFGPTGAVPVPVVVMRLETFEASDLARIDGLVVPWWSSADAMPHVPAIRSFFLNGGDLFILADDPGHDPINRDLGIPTIGAEFRTEPKHTFGQAPLFSGPFGEVASATQRQNMGWLDPADLLMRGGRVVATDPDGRVTAAVWDRNDYAPGSGRLVIATDIDTLVPGLAVYEPLNDNGRFALNATAFLVQGGRVDGLVYDRIGVPSCTISPSTAPFYCGRSGVLRALGDEIGDARNFGPDGIVGRRAVLVEFDEFTPALLLP